jgi:hypothetical protein
MIDETSQNITINACHMWYFLYYFPFDIMVKYILANIHVHIDKVIFIKFLTSHLGFKLLVSSKEHDIYKESNT